MINGRTDLDDLVSRSLGGAFGHGSMVPMRSTRVSDR